MGVWAHAEDAGGFQNGPEQPSSQNEATTEAPGVWSRDSGSWQNNWICPGGEAPRLFKMTWILWYEIAWPCTNDRYLVFTLFPYALFYQFIQTGEELISLHHPKSRQVKQSITSLISHWEALKDAISTRGKVLEGHRDFLEFLQKVEQVEAWIRQKVRKTKILDSFMRTFWGLAHKKMNQ